MRQTLRPESIYNDITRGKLNKIEGVELLTSLIQESEDAAIRAEYIKLFKKIDYKSETIFKNLENCLISDENTIVRNAAAGTIIDNYLKEGSKALTWAIQHEKSPVVLKTIFDSDEVINNGELHEEMTNWIEKFALELGIVPEEARFILDLEALFTKNNENHEINANTFKFYKSISEIQEEGSWFEVYDKNIIALKFNFFNWSYIKENMDVIPTLLRFKHTGRFFRTIKKYFFNFVHSFEIPDSIVDLKSLKYLDLSSNKLRDIPESINSLTSLEQLDLSHNKIREIPESINVLTSLKYLDISHNKIDKNSDSIESLSKMLTEFII
jgi:hypothetical protein